jgi:cytochrome c peroxidase
MIRHLIGALACMLFGGADLAAEALPSWATLFQPLPDQAVNSANELTPEKVALGRTLYFETRFSKSGKLSCNSCHRLDTFGVDNEPTSPGHAGKRGGRNSPSVFNAAIHVAQFWDGRARDVEEQALGPVVNPIEMGMEDAGAVEGVLKGDPKFVEAFAKAFPGDPEPVSFKNFGRAIGAFERTLLTPSRFDRFLKGDSQALTAAEKKGAETFFVTGCVTCHSGVGIGGAMFQKVGLVSPYATKDLGRHEVTRNEADKFVFKVPSLRNVEKTGPYFHDGGVATLEEAVVLMGKHQLGRDLQPQAVSEIVTFLKALTADPVPSF